MSKKIPKIQIDVMLKLDEIKSCGKGAKDDYQRLCRERGIDDNLYFTTYTEAHMEVCKEVWALWHTTKNFKVGDKVYVVPRTHTMFPNCIRAVVTEVNNDGWGYRLRAFRSDLPGIYMFNIWDMDLVPRTGKANRPVPKELLIARDEDGD